MIQRAPISSKESRDGRASIYLFNVAWWTPTLALEHDDMSQPLQRCEETSDLHDSKNTWHFVMNYILGHCQMKKLIKF
jgi:hypothetical protein